MQTKEETKEYQQQYHSENKDKLREYNRLWRLMNKDKVKECSRQYRLENKEKIKEFNHKYRLENKDKLTNKQLKYSYGVTLEQYNEMLNKQSGSCAICGRHQSESKKRLHIDHNHSTGQVRALLCYRCNAGIGLLDEDINRLDMAKLYLLKWNSVK